MAGHWLERHWWRPTALSTLLAPIGWIYCALAVLRRTAYRRGWRRSLRIGVPVIVVGNLTVGGTGKTPLVSWLVRTLAADGWRPGIVSRGYGGHARTWPRDVHADTDPALVGDEPVLLAVQTGRPVVVAPDRVAAARRLLETSDCDIVVADDGLQHLRLARDIEIAVVDDRRGGNGRCLPAGPLREPVGRLATVDAVVCNGSAQAGEISMTIRPVGFRHLVDSGRHAPLDAFRGKRLHAAAGIGNPGRFFALLRRLECDVVEHAYPDHHAYNKSDIVFGDALPVVMTEKDAVKCRSLADERHWYMAIEAVPGADLASLIRTRLRERSHGPQTA